MDSVLVVGSVAYDSVETPVKKVENSLGGSAIYFSAAASLFAPVKVVGVVGDDFNWDDIAFLKEKGVDHLHYMAHIENAKLILALGIFSYNKGKKNPQFPHKIPLAKSIQN